MDAPVLIIAVGAVIAGFVQGLSGFAFSLVAISIWAWTVDPALAAVLAVGGGLTGQIMAAVTVRRGFEAKALTPFLVGGLVGIPLGVLVLPLLDVHLFKAILGALLIVWCPFMLFSARFPAPAAKGRLGDGVAGLLGGVCGGLGGFAGAIPTAWCTLKRLPKDSQRSIVQNFNLVVLAVTMTGYVATGTVTASMLPMLAVVIPAMLIPAFLGARVYIGISETTFRRIVLTLLTLSGVALLSSALPQL